MQDVTIDLLCLGDGVLSPRIEAAAARAHLPLRLHRIATPEAGVALRLQDVDILLVHSPVGEATTALMLADLRKRVGGRIVLVAPALDAERRIQALALGVDHAFDAAVDERELAAVLRNAARRPPQPEAGPREHEAHHRWRLDPDRWMLVAPNAKEVRLSRTEYAVIGQLLDHAGLIQSRPVLMAAAGDSVTRDRVLDVLLSKLRRKVWDWAGMELPLRSARNAGYVFAGRVTAPPAPTQQGAPRMAAVRN